LDIPFYDGERDIFLVEAVYRDAHVIDSAISQPKSDLAEFRL
jgi:hypothetical protein